MSDLANLPTQNKYISDAEIPQTSIDNYISAKNKLPRDTNYQTDPTQELALKDALLQGQFDIPETPLQPTNTNVSVQPNNALESFSTPSKAESVARASQNKVDSLNAISAKEDLAQKQQQLSQMELQANETNKVNKAISFSEYQKVSQLPEGNQFKFFDQTLSNTVSNLNAPHDVGTIVGDTTKGIAVGLLQLANLVPLVANALTGGSVGQDTIQAIQGTIDQLNSSQSEYLKNQRDEVQKRLDINELRNTIKNMKEGNDGKPSAEISAFLQETGLAITELVSNPYLALDLVSQQIPSLLSGSVVAKNLVIGAEKAIAKKTANYLAKTGAKKLNKKGVLAVEKALQKATAKAQTIGGVAFEAAQEGSDVSSQAVNKILNMSEQDLKDNSVKYNEYIKTMSSKEAIQKLAATVGGETLIAGMATTAALSLLTGVGKLRGSLLTKLANKKGFIAGVLKEGSKNFAEELAQGTVTQGVANKIIQSQVDKRVKVRDGLGQEAGFGAVAGGIIGSTLGGISHAGTNDIKKSKDILNTRQKLNKLRTHTIKPTEDLSLPSLETKRNKHKQDMASSKKTLEDLGGIAPMSTSDQAKLSQEDLNKRKTAIENYTKSYNEYKKVNDVIIELKKANPHKTFNDPNATKEVKTAAAKEVFHKIIKDVSTATTEDIKVARQGDLNEEERNFLNSVETLKNTIDNIAGQTGRKSKEVMRDILTLGNKINGKKSIKDYVQIIGSHIFNNNKAQAKEELLNLNKFNSRMRDKNIKLQAAVTSLAGINTDTRLQDLNFNKVQLEAFKALKNIFTFSKDSKYSNAKVSTLISLANNVANDALVVEQANEVLSNNIKIAFNSTNTTTPVSQQNNKINSIERKGRILGMFSKVSDAFKNIKHTNAFNSAKAAVGTALQHSISLRDSRDKTVQHLAQIGILSALVRVKEHNDSNIISNNDLEVFNTLFKTIAESEGEPYTPITQEAIAEQNSMTHAELKKFRKEFNAGTTAQVVTPKTNPNTPTPNSNNNNNNNNNSNSNKTVTTPNNNKTANKPVKDTNHFIGLIKAQNNKFYNMLLPLIIKLLPNGFKIIEDASRFTGRDENTPAMYIYEHKTVYINPKYEFKNSDLEMTILHEMVHTVLPYIENNKVSDGLSLIKVTAIKQLISLFNELKTEYNNLENKPKSRQIEYAFTDINEFLAVSLSNIDMQKYLQNTQQYKGHNGFSEFVSIIMKFLGLSKENTSAFTDMLESVAVLLDANIVNPPKASSIATTPVLTENPSNPPSAPSDKPVSIFSGVMDLRSDEDVNKDNTLGATQNQLKFKSNIEGNESLLHNVTDPFSSFGTFINAANDFLTKVLKQVKLTRSEREKLNNYTKNVKMLRDHIDSLLSIKEHTNSLDNIELNSKPIILLTDTDGKLFDGISNAIAIAVFDYMAMNAESILNPDSEYIAKLLGMGILNIPPEVITHFKENGIPIDMVSAKLGKSILNSLNITTREHTKYQLQARLESSIGRLAIESLLTIELNDENTTAFSLKQLNLSSIQVSNPIYTDVMVEIQNKFPNPIQTIIPAKKFGEVQKYAKIPLHADLNNIITNIKEVMHITRKLFSLGSNIYLPVFEKPTRKDINNMMKGTNRQVSPQQMDALESMITRPQTVKIEMLEAFNAMTREEQESLLEKHSEASIAEAHIDDREGMLGFNLEIDNQIDSVNEFIATMPNKSSVFYFMHNVYKQLRMGMQSGTINPQQSHLHRHLFQSENLNNVLLRITPKSISKIEKIARLAIAQSFDVKIENQSENKSLNFIIETLEREDVKLAINMIKGTEPLIMSHLIKVASSFGSKPIYALDGLYALASILKAKESGKSQDISFTLFFEVDGKTSGTWLTKTQLANEQNATNIKQDLTRGGAIFNEINSPELDFYEDYASESIQGILRSYQTNIINLEKGIENEKDTKKRNTKIFILNKIISSQAAFIKTNSDFFNYTEQGTLIYDEIGIPKINENNIRSFGKEGLTPANYGSGIVSQATIVLRTTINILTGNIAKGVKAFKNDLSQTNKDNLIEVIQAAIDLEFDNNNETLEIALSTLEHSSINSLLLNAADTVLETPLRIGKYNALFDASKDGMTVALQKQQRNILTSRKIILSQAAIIIHLYNTALSSLLDIGNTITKAEFKEITKKLEKLYPAFHNYFSQINNNINQGTTIHNNGEVISSSPIFSGIETPVNSESGTINRASRAATQEKVSSGLGANVGNIIGLDATIMSIGQSLLGNIAGLNLHDAFTLSIHDVANGVPQAINRITYEVLTGFNILEMTSERLENVLLEYNKLIEHTQSDLPLQDIKSINNILNSVPPSIIKNIEESGIEVIKNDKGKFSLNTTLDYIKAVSIIGKLWAEENTFNMKENGLNTAIEVNQYSSPYGGFKPKESNIESTNILGLTFKPDDNTSGLKDSEGNIALDIKGIMRRKGLSKFKSEKEQTKYLKAKKEYEAGLEKRLQDSFNKGKKRIQRQDNLEDNEANNILDPKEGSLGNTSNDTSKITEGSIYDTIDEENVIHIFDSMFHSDVTPPTQEHSSYLRNMLTNLVQKAINPIELIIRKTNNVNKGYFDTTANTLYMDIITEMPSTDRNSFSGMIASSKQEIFVRELLHTLTVDTLDKRTDLKHELTKIYNQARKHFKIEDFIPENTYDVDSKEYDNLYREAETIYDKMFSPLRTTTYKSVVNPITGKKHRVILSSHLTDFFTMALTNKTMISKLNSLAGSNTKPANLWEKIKTFLSKILNIVSFKLYNIKTYEPDSSLYLSTVRLAASLSSDIQRIKQAKTATEGVLVNTYNDATDKLYKVADLVRKGVGSALAKTRFSSVKLVGDLINPDTNITLDFVLDQLDDYRGKIREGKEGFINSTLSEIRGGTYRNQEINNVFLRLKSELSAQRDKIIAATKHVSENTYKTDLSKNDKNILTKFIIRMDFTSLHKRMSESDITELSKYLTDDSKLASRIQYLVTQLHNLPQAKNNNISHYYNRLSESLGSIMVHGKPTEEIYLDNAYNIARGNDGTGIIKVTEKEADAAEDIIDELSSLYAIQTSSLTDKVTFSNIIKQDVSGVRTSILLHKSFKEESLQKSLEGQRALVTKGYTKDITNPHVGIQIVDEEQGRLLEKLGYVKGNPVPRNRLFTTVNTSYIYKNPHGGKSPIVSGLLSIASDSSMGTSIDESFLINATNRNIRLARSIYAPKRSKTTIKYTVLKSIHSASGEITNFNAVMSQAQKDILLERDNNFHRVIAGMHGSIVTKVVSKKGNKEVIDLLYDNHINKTKGVRELFIGEDSRDNILKNAWNTLPKPTREYASSIFGEEGIYIPKESLDLIMGYRKFNIQDIWTMSKKEQKWHHTVLMGIAEAFLGNKAPKHLKTLTDLMEGMASLAKTNVIIKGYVVTAYNYLSNVNTLRIMGVPFRTILAKHSSIYKEAKRYQDNAKKLAITELLIKTGNGSKHMQEELTLLQNSLDTSSLDDSVKAGMLTTIVEDIDPDNEVYGYKAKWKKDMLHRVNKIGKHVPDNIKTLGSEFFMLQGSTMFEMANNMVHLSDFTARQIYMEHVTTRKENPLNKKEAFEKAMNLFVSYDLPTNKTIQALNDIGVLWYTKFLMRNPKAKLQLIQDNPKNSAVYGLLGLMDVPLIDSILDPSITPNSIMQRVGFAPTALLDSIGEIAPLNVATNLTPSF